MAYIFVGIDFKWLFIALNFIFVVSFLLIYCL